MVHTKTVATLFLMLFRHISAELSPSVHAFFYLWYGTPEFDGDYMHWNHAVLPHWTKEVNEAYPSVGSKHEPPSNLHSAFYPLQGPYSTKDPDNLSTQFADMIHAKIDVAVVSWWGQPDNKYSSDTQGIISDLAMHHIFRAADKNGKLKIAVHLEPYHSRSVESIRSDVSYIIESYGNYSSFFRSSNELPLFYVYDSYHIAPEQWGRLLTHDGDISVRGTPLDAVFIGLWLDRNNGHDLKEGGFDGIYTYFASDGFSFGSSSRNWKEITEYCRETDMISILSVGPGYDDSSIRPWNTHNTKDRRDGQYYTDIWNAAIAAKPSIVSITSYNEWGEGTQIEPARSVSDMEYPPRKYLNYGESGPYTYLKLTSEFATKFMAHNSEEAKDKRKDEEL